MCLGANLAKAQAACSYAISGPAPGTTIDVGGTSVSLTDDAVTGAIPIGFNFNFFGSTYTDFVISSNGYISFNLAVGAGCCSGQLLPNNTSPDNLIAGFWEDLNPGSAGTIGYGVFGVAPARRMVISYTGVDHYPSGLPVTFQIKLHESSNVVEVVCIDCPTDGGLNTQGIENLGGTVAFVPSGRNNTSFASTNETTTFTPIDQTAPGITCPANISVPCSQAVTFSSATGSDNCSFARVTQIAGLSSGATFPTGTNTVTFRARDHGSAGVFNNGAGGTFSYNEGDSPQTIALKACESVYGTGNCVVGACGAFTYYYRSGHLTCNCGKTPGQYEFVYANSSYTDVGQDYGGTNATVSGVPFVRVKGSGSCSVPNTWLLSNDRLGGLNTDCSFSVVVGSGVTASNAGPDQTVCGTSATLAANTPSVGTGSWSIISGGGGSVTTPSSPTSGFTGVAGTTYTLRWTIAQAPCASSTDDVVITLRANPTAANAGPDQSLCSTTVNLAANTPSVGTGAWSIISGAGGNVTTASNPTSTFTGVAGTTYTLRWTISNAPCAASTDDVVITITAAPPAANAGPDQSICGAGATLAGNAPGTGTGSWSIISGAGGSVTTPSSPTSGFTGVAGTSYTLRWTISNPPCATTTDDVVINLVATPTASNAGPDQTLCGTTATLAANAPAAGTGSWSIVSGGGGVVTTPSSPTSAFSGVSGTTYTLRWTISNAPCAASTDDVIVTLTAPVAAANAGPDQNICGTAATLAGNSAGTGSGSWSIISGAGGSIATPSSPTSGFTAVVGNVYTLRWTITNAPCAATSDDVIISTDVTNPAISCPGNMTANNTTGACSAVVTYTAPVGTDNCPSPSTAQIAGLASGSTFPVGVTTNTFRVTDGAGRTSTCSFTVTVADIQAPSISCPANFSANVDPGTCTALLPYPTPVGTDNCSGATTNRTTGLATNSLFPIGPTTCTFVVTDAAGNTASCAFTATIVDNIAPVMTCPASQTLNNDPGLCTAVANFGGPTVTENCVGGSVAQTSGLPSGSSFPLGVTTNVLRATDGSGNTGTCSFTITVVDNQLPTVNCQPSITLNADPGACSTTYSFASPVGTDNCPGVTTVQSAGLTSGSTFPVGLTNIKFTSTDAAGNTNSCAFIVTVVDNQVPTITCPANLNVNTDPGLCSATATFSTPTMADNCSGVTLSQTAGFASGSAFPSGITPNTFRATDASGNTASCSFLVIVNDVENPTITCPPAQTVNTTSGGCNAVVTYSAPTNTDNCGAPLMQQTAGLASGATFPIGATTNTFEATDLVGNSSTCSFVVTVVDATAPTWSACPSNITMSTTSNACSAPVNWTAPTATDNCSVPTSTTTHTPGSVFTLGTTAVTYTAQDASGNSSTCAFNVTVNDAVPPVAACQPVTVNLNSSGNGSTTVSAINNGSSDNCSLANVTISQTAFTCTNAGSNTVILTATDGAGNTSTCAAIVTVVAPAVSSTATVDPAQCGFQVSCNGASDGVAHATGSGGCAPYTFLWSNGATTPTVTGLSAGVYTVTVTDGAGGSHVSTVTLTEPSPLAVTSVPDSVCPGDIDGIVNISVSGGNSCQGYTYLWNTGSTSQDLSGVGAGTYDVTVTDISGCTATHSMTVVAYTPPVPAFTQSGLVLTSSQTWSTYQWLLNGSNIIGANANSYTVTQSGSYSLSVTDANGCEGVSDTTNVTVVGVEAGMGAWGDLSLYPNPARGEFRLRAAAPIGYEIRVRIYDLYGKQYGGQVLPELSHEAAFDISKFSAGTYFVEVVSDYGQRKLFKLVVQ